MRKPNEARGEFEIELGGETYGMRPSHEAIDAFERATGLSKMETADAAGRSSLKTWQVAIIVTECIQAWGRAVDHKETAGFKVARIQELLAGENMLVVYKRLELMLFLATTGGLTPSGEAKALKTPRKPAASTEPAS